MMDVKLLVKYQGHLTKMIWFYEMRPLHGGPIVAAALACVRSSIHACRIPCRDIMMIIRVALDCFNKRKTPVVAMLVDSA